MQADALTVGFHEMVSLGMPYQGAVSLDGMAGLSDDCSMILALILTNRIGWGDSRNVNTQTSLMS